MRDTRHETHETPCCPEDMCPSMHSKVGSCLSPGHNACQRPCDGQKRAAFFSIPGGRASPAPPHRGEGEPGDVGTQRVYSVRWLVLCVAMLRRIK